MRFLYIRTEILKKIIFTGGTKFEAELEEARTARVYAMKQGVKEEDILIETKSLFTEENLKKCEASWNRERHTNIHDCK